MFVDGDGQFRSISYISVCCISLYAVTIHDVCIKKHINDLQSLVREFVKCPRVHCQVSLYTCAVFPVCSSGHHQGVGGAWRPPRGQRETRRDNDDDDDDNDDDNWVTSVNDVTVATISKRRCRRTWRRDGSARRRRRRCCCCTPMTSSVDDHYRTPTCRWYSLSIFPNSTVSYV